MIDRQAPAQRSGVLASLNMVADTLKLLPSEKEDGWAVERGGVVERTQGLAVSHEHARNASAPRAAHELVARHAGAAVDESRAAPVQRKVWFVLDELASLQRLPQLHTAITENRKSNNPVVLGFQGRSQLETRYGHEAEAMLSQPATKIFLRTSELHAAEWISRTIGDS